MKGEFQYLRPTGTRLSDEEDDSKIESGQKNKDFSLNEKRRFNSNL